DFVNLNSFGEGSSHEPKDPQWRMSEPGRFRAPSQGHMNFMGNLGRDLVKRQRGDQAYHARPNLSRDRDEFVGLRRWKIGQPKERAVELFDYALLPHLIKGSRMDSPSQRRAGTQHSTFFAKQLPLFLIGVFGMG